MRVIAVRSERGVREPDGQLYVRVRGRLRGNGRPRRMRGRQRVLAARHHLRRQRQVREHPRVVHVRVPAGVHGVRDRLLPKLVCAPVAAAVPGVLFFLYIYILPEGNGG